MVSRVINHDPTLLIKDETREKIQNAVKELNYSPNAIAKSLRKKTTETVAILIPDLMNPFFHELVKGSQDFFINSDISLILCDTNDDKERERKYIDLLYNKQIDGLLIATIHNDNFTEELLGKYNLNYVIVNRSSKNNKASVIKTEDFEGAKMAVKHLAELGHKKIAHISGPIFTETGYERLSGFRQAMIENNLVCKQEYIIHANYNEQDGYTSMMKLLKSEDPPTALFAANDIMAMGAIKAVKDSGLSVPEDISIVGYNDIWIACHMAPPLTTVKTPLYDMGYLGAELLYEQVTGKSKEKRNIILPVELIVRSSTACPKQE